MATDEEKNKTAQKRRPRGEVRVFGWWCKGCGLCIAFCPAEVFEADEEGHPHVRFPERCTGCRWCESHCPDMAIEVVRYTPSDDTSERS